MIDPHGDQSIGESAAVPMNVLTKKQSARVEGLKEALSADLLLRIIDKQGTSEN